MKNIVNLVNFPEKYAVFRLKILFFSFFCSYLGKYSIYNIEIWYGVGVYRTHFFGFGTESLKPNIENRYSVPNLLKPNIVTRYSAEPEPNSSLKMM